MQIPFSICSCLLKNAHLLYKKDYFGQQLILALSIMYKEAAD